jgi:hypothetical protein
MSILWKVRFTSLIICFWLAGRKVDGLIDGCMDGRMDWCLGGWVNQWMDGCVCLLNSPHENKFLKTV